MGDILAFILAVIVIFLPIILWAYGFSILYTKEFHRFRFFTGLVTGSIIVGGVIGIEQLPELDPVFLVPLWCISLFLLSLGISTIVLSGSKRRLIIPNREHIQVFLIHSFLFSLILGLTSSIPHSLWLSGVGGVIFGYILRATIEESTKHIGYASTDLSLYQSKQSMLMMTFFVVLGFVFIENILYLREIYTNNSLREFLHQWILRSLFSLIAHIFLSFLITYGWWRAIRYGVFSPRYFLVFLSGTILSIFGHTLYNTLVSQNHILGVLLFTFFGIFAMSAMMWREEVKNITT